MIIRDLSRDDIQKIVELESEFKDGWSLGQLSSAFNGGRFYVLGAFEKEELIGFVSFSVAIDTCDIETVLVKSDYRRRGVARTLIENAEKIIKNLGVKKVFLEVRETNMPAITLYGGLGFDKISIRKDYYLDGENAIVMAKELL